MHIANPFPFPIFMTLVPIWICGRQKVMLKRMLLSLGETKATPLELNASSSSDSNDDNSSLGVHTLQSVEFPKRSQPTNDSNYKFLFLPVILTADQKTVSFLRTRVQERQATGAADCSLL